MFTPACPLVTMSYFSSPGTPHTAPLPLEDNLAVSFPEEALSEENLNILPVRAEVCPSKFTCGHPDAGISECDPDWEGVFKEGIKLGHVGGSAR